MTEESAEFDAQCAQYITAFLDPNSSPLPQSEEYCLALTNKTSFARDAYEYIASTNYDANTDVDPRLTVLTHTAPSCADPQPSFWSKSLLDLDETLCKEFAHQWAPGDYTVDLTTSGTCCTTALDDTPRVWFTPSCDDSSDTVWHSVCRTPSDWENCYVYLLDVLNKNIDSSGWQLANKELFADESPCYVLATSDRAEALSRVVDALGWVPDYATTTTGAPLAEPEATAHTTTGGDDADDINWNVVVAVSTLSLVVLLTLWVAIAQSLERRRAKKDENRNAAEGQPLTAANALWNKL